MRSQAAAGGGGGAAPLTPGRVLAGLLKLQRWGSAPACMCQQCLYAHVGGDGGRRGGGGGGGRGRGRRRARGVGGAGGVGVGVGVLRV